MRKTIPAVTSALILATASIHANAQKANDMVKLDELKNHLAYAPVAEKISETKSDLSVLNRINFRAVRDFMKTNPGILNEKWEILKTGYIASFDADSKWQRLYYDKNGNWLHSISQYSEKGLAKDLRAVVKREYYDYAITLVQEITINNKNNYREPIYLIHLNYDEAYKTLRVCDGEMEEITL